MARYFFDSSALVKRYHEESGSSTVGGLFAGAGNQFLISRLALVEVHSSLARLVREGILSGTDFSTVISRLDHDVANGVLVVAALSGQRLTGASSLLATQGLTRPLRTLDAIHLTTAMALHNRHRFAAFVAADKKLLASAADCGLTTLEVG